VITGKLMVGLDSLQAKGRGTVEFAPWDDEEVTERIERLKRAIENQQQRLTAIEDRLDEEAQARLEAVGELQARLHEVNRELRGLITEAAAGGLRLETIGVALFLVGVCLGILGNLLT
jgi:predicted nuclease with TOPRIM domain